MKIDLRPRRSFLEMDGSYRQFCGLGLRLIRRLGSRLRLRKDTAVLSFSTPLREGFLL